jgi:hypothetical protein
VSESTTHSEWDFAKIQALVDGGIEERYDLEYKGAGTLRPKDKKTKDEIVKDVSAMANSAGGTIIYGIAEKNSPGSAPHAEKIDPVNRSVFSADTLDQVIQSVQPKIDGVFITPIEVPDSDGKALYVVSVPQSVTAHQARDKKYHKRRNTTTDAMEDYEIRDVMNRGTSPKIRVSFIFETFPDKIGLKICVHNEGKIAANLVRVFIRLPLCMGLKIQEREGRLNLDGQTMTHEYYWKNLHYDFVGKSLASDATKTGWADTKPTEDCYVTRDSPILPNMNLTSNHAISLTPQNFDKIKGMQITWEAYADNAPARSGTLELDEVHKQLSNYYIERKEDHAQKENTDPHHQ